MKLVSKHLLLALVAMAALNACRSEGSDSEAKAVDKNGSWTPSNDAAVGNQIFGLAKFAKSNEAMQSIRDNVGSGDAFIFFGDKDKFRAEMNLTVQTTGDLQENPKDRTIAAGYWLDTFVFGKQIGGDRDRGLTLDLGAVGHLDTLSLDASLRFVGQDLYRGKIMEAAYENSFVRDFNYTTTWYPVPLLGLKVGGKVGGELGMRAQAGVRRDNALGVSFTPRATINGALSGGIELIKFASAEAIGSAKLADLKIGSSANIGLAPSARFTYGNIGIDGGRFSALEGKVELYARAGLNGLLPSGLGGGLWNKLLGAVGLAKDYEFRHTVWDPKTPLYVADLPRYGTDFASFLGNPKDKAECEDRRNKSLDHMRGHKEALVAYRDGAVDFERKTADASVFYFENTEKRVADFCK